MSTTRQNLGRHLWSSLFNCMADALGVAIAICLSLMSLILMSGSAQAQASLDYMGLPVVEDLSDLQSGQLVFRSASGHYLTSPSIDTDVVIDISGLLARVTVSQSFLNPTAQWQEGIYVFPLPETAAVDHLRMKVGERIIEGEIKSKKVARAIYEKAKSAGKQTSLIEQQRPNMFTSSVANIAPGDKISVIIEYQQVITQTKNDFSVRFPMAITPRYIPGEEIINNSEVQQFNGNGWAVNTDQVPDASHITPPVILSNDSTINVMTLKVNLAAGFQLDQVESRYHLVEQVTLEDDKRRITLINNEAGTKSLTIWY